MDAGRQKCDVANLGVMHSKTPPPTDCPRPAPLPGSAPRPSLRANDAPGLEDQLNAATEDATLTSYIGDRRRRRGERGRGPRVEPSVLPAVPCRSGPSASPLLRPARSRGAPRALRAPAPPNVGPAVAAPPRWVRALPPPDRRRRRRRRLACPRTSTPRRAFCAACAARASTDSPTPGDGLRSRPARPAPSRGRPGRRLGDPAA